MKKTITAQQKVKIIELSLKGYRNRQISIEIGMKYATLCYWKSKMRQEGIIIPNVSGRPKRGSLPTLLNKVEEYKDMLEKEKTPFQASSSFESDKEGKSSK